MTTREQYQQFLKCKLQVKIPTGISEPDEPHASLFPFQRDVTKFLLRKGRAAAFLDTGLGKTRVQLEWARQIPGKVLILSPLAVAAQTVREGQQVGLDIYHSKDGSTGRHITIANYERLHKFDLSQFTGVVLDESSILKSFMGSTKQQLCDVFNRYQYKLCCTATPAPNDYMELGNHSDFLSVMPANEMLARWFINDTMNFGCYRLKKHAVKSYWEWIADWAACLEKPSDAGYDDGSFKLPPLNVELHQLTADWTTNRDEGELFRASQISATTMHKEKQLSANARCEHVAKLTSNKEPWIVWCESNQESEMLADMITDAVEVKGADSIDVKEERLESFSNGHARVIVTKPSIAGFGLNWQHCNNVAFASISYSYEQYYQAIRRSWRFGQKRPVNVHVVISETEISVWQTVMLKQEAHRSMKSAMQHAIFNSGREYTTCLPYNPQHQTILPKWIHCL